MEVERIIFDDTKRKQLVWFGHVTRMEESTVYGRKELQIGYPLERGREDDQVSVRGRA